MQYVGSSFHSPVTFSPLVQLQIMNRPMEPATVTQSEVKAKNPELENTTLRQIAVPMNAKDVCGKKKKKKEVGSKINVLRWNCWYAESLVGVVNKSSA